MPRLLTVVLSLLMVLTAAFPTGSVFAQDFGADPNYGTISLNAGFQPDPRVVNLTAGGSISASSASSGCRGYTTDAPDVRLHYTSGSYPLIISVNSSVDTTLLVNAPNGTWYCDDDSGSGSNPLLRFNSPQSGRYEIWVGTFSSGSYPSASLSITERSSQAGSSVEGNLSDDLELHGVSPTEDCPWYNPYCW